MRLLRIRRLESELRNGPLPQADVARYLGLYLIVHGVNGFLSWGLEDRNETLRQVWNLVDLLGELLVIWHCYRVNRQGATGGVRLGERYLGLYCTTYLWFTLVAAPLFGFLDWFVLSHGRGLLPPALVVLWVNPYGPNLSELTYSVLSIAVQYVWMGRVIARVAGAAGSESTAG